MKFLLIGLNLLLLFTTTQARPQANTVRFDVQVTHVKSTEGVPEALITLQGPYSASSTSLYTPSSALTPEMREQIDILFKSAPTGISGAIVIATIPGLNGIQVQAMGRTRVQVPDVGIAGNVTVTLKPPQPLKLHPILDGGAMGAPGTTPPVRLFPRSLELYSAPFEANAVAYSIDASGDFVFPNILKQDSRSSG
jgi:hypothetical protein